MCMTLNSLSTADDIFQDKEEIICYKIVKKDRSSPFYGFGPRRTYYNTDDVVVSDRRYSSLSSLERLDMLIVDGLHLCQDRENAVNSLTYLREAYDIEGEVISVSVKREHFVATGWWSERPSLTCIVATQCTVLE